MNECPQVYIASLSAYNAGKLIGKWVDATCQDDMRDAIQELPGEEWAFHDYEDMPRLGENPPLELVEGIAKCVENFGLDVVDAWIGIMDKFHIWKLNSEDVLDELENVYCGTYKSVEEFGWEQLDSLLGDIPAEVVHHIDVEGYGLDALNDSFRYDQVGGEVIVFYNI